jgi:hypothetical protein
VLAADAGDSWRQLDSRMCLLQEKSPHGIGPHQGIVVGEVGGNSRSSKKASVTDLQESLSPTSVYVRTVSEWAYVLVLRRGYRLGDFGHRRTDTLL